MIGKRLEPGRVRCSSPQTGVGRQGDWPCICWGSCTILSLELTWLRGVDHLLVTWNMVFRTRGHAIHFDHAVVPGSVWFIRFEAGQARSTQLLRSFKRERLTVRRGAKNTSFLPGLRSLGHPGGVASDVYQQGPWRVMSLLAGPFFQSKRNRLQ